MLVLVFFFFQAEDGIRDDLVTGVQTCALPICSRRRPSCSAVSASIMRLGRLSGLIASGEIVAHPIDTIERAAIDVAPFQRVVRIAPPLLQRSGDRKSGV